MNALDVSGLRAGYGSLRVLHGIDLRVAPGEILTVLGRNGSGRSTLLRAVMGLVPAQGTIRVQGRPVEALATHERAAAGLAYVPETRDVFPSLTVDQNLRLGLRRSPVRGPSPPAWTVDALLERFPILARRRHVVAAALSGGEQQMLTLSRSLLLQPRILLVDEPTEGLSPAMTATVRDLLRDVADSGCAVVLVEQKLTMAMGLSDRCVVLARGEVVFEGLPGELDDAHPVVRDWLDL